MKGEPGFWGQSFYVLTRDLDRAPTRPVTLAEIREAVRYQRALQR